MYSFLQADAYGILQPAHATGTVGRELPPFVTWSCMLGGCSVTWNSKRIKKVCSQAIVNWGLFSWLPK